MKNFFEEESKSVRNQDIGRRLNKIDIIERRSLKIILFNDAQNFEIIDIKRLK